MAAVLILRRLPATLALALLTPDIEHRHDALFVGWFGPIGVAALYYAALATTRHSGIEEVWVMATLVIVASIVAHGMSVSPLIRRYARAEGRRRASMH